MSERIVRLTREELYDLVWSKPMTVIAAEFGMSSVAFAKYCKALDVPRPGRGRWQQLAAGQKAARDNLPKAKAGAPEAVTIERYARPGLGKRSPVEIPKIPIPEKVTRYHPVAKELVGLARPDVHHQRMPVLKIGEPSRRRVLRLLHALFTGIERNGHEVRLTKQSEESSWQRGRRSLAINIDGSAIEMSLREHLVRKVHEKTDHEKQYTWMSRQYDLEPSGILILELDIPWGTHTRTRWRDGDKGQLEDYLGEMLWAIEEAARGLVVHRSRVADEARLAEIAREQAKQREHERQLQLEAERQQREAEARLAAQRKALHDDLLSTANAWRQADIVREFLHALSTKVPEHERTLEFRAWFAWAIDHAAKLDPLAEPVKVARPIAI